MNDVNSLQSIPADFLEAIIVRSEKDRFEEWSFRLTAALANNGGDWSKAIGVADRCLRRPAKHDRDPILSQIFAVLVGLVVMVGVLMLLLAIDSVFHRR